MRLDVLFLGTGTSHGVPMIGCDCAVCTSDDPRDSRNRASVLIRAGDQNILIDTPPELRVSCIRYGVRRVDEILFTHHHADHLMGLDDVRRFNHISSCSMRCWATPETLSEIRRVFSYAFGSAHIGGGLPAISLSPVTGRFQIDGLSVVPLPVMHGPTPVTGYRIGDFAYVTDVKTIPETTMRQLHGLDLLVLGVLRYRPHSTHLSVDEALEVVGKLEPRRVLFTHMAHNLGHAETQKNLPDGVGLAYDGLRVTTNM